MTDLEPLDSYVADLLIILEEFYGPKNLFDKSAHFGTPIEFFQAEIYRFLLFRLGSPDAFDELCKGVLDQKDQYSEHKLQVTKESVTAALIDVRTSTVVRRLIRAWVFLLTLPAPTLALDHQPLEQTGSKQLKTVLTGLDQNAHPSARGQMLGKPDPSLLFYPDSSLARTPREIQIEIESALIQKDSSKANTRKVAKLMEQVREQVYECNAHDLVQLYGELFQISQPRRQGGINTDLVVSAQGISEPIHVRPENIVRLFLKADLPTKMLMMRFAAGRVRAEMRFRMHQANQVKNRVKDSPDSRGPSRKGPSQASLPANTHPHNARSPFYPAALFRG